MSISSYFQEKCLNNLEENLAMTWAKLTDPASWVTVDISGGLVDAAEGGLGPLAAFAGDYLTQNADALLMEAAEAAGLGDVLADAMNFVFSIMTTIMMMYNDIILMMLKKVAANGIVAIGKKKEILEELKDNLVDLHNLLVMLAGGESIFDKYVAMLRQALGMIMQSQTEIQMVRNSLAQLDLYLKPTFKQAKTRLESAQKLLVPYDKNPFVKSESQAGKNKELLLSLVGAEQFSDEQKMSAMMQIPPQTVKVLKSSQGYASKTMVVNALLDGFTLGMGQLATGMPALFKKFVISEFDKTLKRIGSLVNGMNEKLYGEPGQLDFEPQPIEVSVMSFKWAMDLSMILSGMKLIPEKALDDLALAAGPVLAYQNVVNQLYSMDGVSNEFASLVQEDGKEATGTLESQILVFCLEANAAIISSDVKKEILSLSTAMIKRVDLSINTDAKIAALLQTFVDYPLPSEQKLKDLLESLSKLMEALGLAEAAAALASGDFTKLFNLNSTTATAVGAALLALSLLKECYNMKDTPDLDELKNDLEADKDLLNIKITFNFDLAILKNIEECLKLLGYAQILDLKAIFCLLLQQNSSVNEASKKLAKMLSF